MSKVPSFLQDETFQDRLLKILSVDPTALKQCASLLQPSDFRPQKGQQHARPRWIVAECVLDYYKRFQQPVGKLLRADVLEYSTRTGLGERQVAEIEEYLQYLRKVPTTAPDAIVEKVQNYKYDRLRASVIEELVEAQSAGILTNEMWQTLSAKALNGSNGHHASTDYYNTLEDRIEYRSLLQNHSVSKTPVFFIDPLDMLIRGCGPGELGLVMAPTGRGKSLALVWFAIMFSLQRLNILFITLEDPREHLEARFDAAVAGIQMAHLADLPKTLRARFQRFRGKHSILQTRLRIVDGTENGMTVAQIEEALLNERNQGFKPDVLIVDYDEEITPAVRNKERRFEYSDIYRDLRRLAARQNMVTWTAAQTQRGTEKLKILAGDKIAEDFGKIRKCSLVLSLGKGDWGETSIYAHVVKAKFSPSGGGCHIVPDMDRMLIYDREATRRAKLQYDNPVEQEEEEEDV